ncbi:MAG TPA: glycine zipper 2TM domain-containing protein [Albitalea sp.]
MKINHQLSILALAIAAAVPMALPTAAQAQVYSTAPAATIASFGVDPVRRLRPGNVLAFRIDATPGALVMLQIEGASTGLRMSEVRPGRYEGQYTIREGDRLSANSLVTARVVKDGRSATATLSRSLLRGAPDPVPNAHASIAGFTVSAPDRIRPGDELNFALTGAPGGQARVAVEGVPRRIALTEVRQGVYEGSYVVRRKDKLRGALVADGYLVSAGRETSTRFERESARSSNGSGRFDQQGARQMAVACAACGAVQSVDLVEVKGDSPNVIGTIAGGVLGGVIGNQVGGGKGRDLATIVGAVGGAYAGNRIENKMDKRKVFRVTVRLEGGETQHFDYAEDPAVQVGTRVRVENGNLIRL